MIPANSSHAASSPMVAADKRKRLMLRKQAMFRRANSLDCLCSGWGEQQSPPTSPTATATRRTRRPARRVVSESDIDSTPLVQQRWESEQKTAPQAASTANANNTTQKADKPPRTPSSSSSRRVKRSRSKTTSPQRQRPGSSSRPKICRWDSDKSLDSAPTSSRRSSRGLSPSRSPAARLTHTAPRKPCRRQASDVQ